MAYPGLSSREIVSASMDSAGSFAVRREIPSLYQFVTLEGSNSTVAKASCTAGAPSPT